MEADWQGQRRMLIYILELTRRRCRPPRVDKKEMQATSAQDDAELLVTLTSPPYHCSAHSPGSPSPTTC
jgi:hypothetical protein